MSSGSPTYQIGAVLLLPPATHLLHLLRKPNLRFTSACEKHHDFLDLLHFFRCIKCEEGYKRDNRHTVLLVHASRIPRNHTLLRGQYTVCYNTDTRFARSWLDVDVEGGESRARERREGGQSATTGTGWKERSASSVQFSQSAERSL